MIILYWLILLEEMMRSFCFDLGSGGTKIGVTDNNFEFYSLTSKPIFQKLIGDNKIEKLYFNETLDNRATYEINYPIERGIIKDWDFFEKVLTFKQNFDVKDQNLLFNDSALSSIKNKRKIAEICFEKFNIESISFHLSNFASLIASGRDTGTVLCSGEGITSTVSFINGKIIHNSAQRDEFGGKDLTLRFAKDLRSCNFYYENNNDLEMVREIKEKFGRFKTEGLDSNNYNNTYYYKLPDNTSIDIDSDVCEIPQFLFINSHVKRSVQKQIFDSINKVNDNREDLYQNIILEGGNTLFKEFDKNLQVELEKLTKEKISVYSNKDPTKLVIKGLKMISSLDSMKSFIVSKKEFEENGKESLIKFQTIKV